MLSGEMAVETEPKQILGEHGSIRAACAAIWNDLEQNHKNLLIDLAKSNSLHMVENKAVKLLKNYGLLTDQERFFSPLLACPEKKKLVMLLINQSR
jgi:hypothetical protein